MAAQKWIEQPARWMTWEEAKGYDIAVFTLDSHEFWGPFETWAKAHAWAKAKPLSSYQVQVKQYK